MLASKPTSTAFCAGTADSSAVRRSGFGDAVLLVQQREDSELDRVAPLAERQ